MWHDIIKIKHFYLKGRRFNIKNSKDCAFWMDRWLDSKALCELFPALFSLCTDKNINVYSVLNKEGQFSFIRWLPPLLFDQWLQILDRVYAFRFENSNIVE